jgi:hypothetical protein
MNTDLRGWLHGMQLPAGISANEQLIQIFADLTTSAKTIRRRNVQRFPIFCGKMQLNYKCDVVQGFLLNITDGGLENR